MGNTTSDISIFHDGELEMAFEKSGVTLGGDITIWNLLKKSYGQLINTIIRPKRERYALSALGAEEFVIRALNGRDTTIKRFDSTIKNERQLSLSCSHWKIMHADGVTVKKVNYLTFLL